MYMQLHNTEFLFDTCMLFCRWQGNEEEKWFAVAPEQPKMGAAVGGVKYFIYVQCRSCTHVKDF